MEDAKSCYRPACQATNPADCSHCSLAYDCRSRQSGLPSGTFPLIALAMVSIMVVVGALF